MKTKQLLRYFLFVCVFALGTLSALAQEQKVTGKVTNQKTGTPISNVTVKVKNGTQSVLTDDNGLPLKSLLLSPSSLFPMWAMVFGKEKQDLELF
jgi:hypothetical protein